MNKGRAVFLVVLAAAAFAAGWALFQLVHQRAALRVILGLRWWWLGPWMCVSLACAARLSITALRSDRERPSRLCALAVVGVFSWLGFLLLVHPYQKLWLELALGVAGGAWMLVVLILDALAHPLPKFVSRSGMALFGLCLAVPCLELGLRAWALASPRPWLARVSDAPSSVIERFRLAPGTVRFGFPCNSRGFYDEECSPPPRPNRLIAAIGDSFLLGSVPHAFNLTSVCEASLGLEVANISVAGAGPSEYLRLLVDEASPLEPSAVVVGVFVGNDLNCADLEAGRSRSWLGSWFARESSLTWIVPRRLLRRAAERRRQIDPERRLGEVPGEALRQMDPLALHKQMPWLDDPLLEPESMSREAFLELEARRALEICRGLPPGLALLERELGRMREMLGSTPLVVVLWPDEFQVEDDLWKAVLERAAIPLDRDLPQRLVRERLERTGIPALDLLPILRAIAPLADGNRHLYHLRDTHFNARGNLAAGRALARYLEEQGYAR